MYENFFGFVEKPFNLTPDSHYLYSSPQHQGVIETLYYGIKERKGFLFLTGEVGTGKTTSMRALLNRLGEEVKTSLIINPLLSTLDLIQTINRDFGCGANAEPTLNAQLDALYRFLLENDKNGGNALVIIDEAQNLSFEALETTRLLSNLETETHKLVQILFVGQPELEEKLAHHSLRQLAQRIQIFCRLKPLQSPDTTNYILHRLQRAGNAPQIAFESAAIKEIYKRSKGVPRIINTLCELALLVAFSRDTRVITKRLIKEAAREAPVYVHYS